ncbi:unnamed protein product [Acanthoscelides obtectus]|uniref:DUF7041 domain-containing protein n=1 Tax=Acanthoscelides obtectus TaxID=200917 RepID=A0A9P0PWH0_ACAOB|nr:unnamed protein product [Acanthoscelides obtectus]CAK1663617.1 hypothetical protein AOBTE_LOCUS23750 [Acanthoscelides obtectus]
MGNYQVQALQCVSTPIPPYNSQNPKLWFLQVESGFKSTWISDDKTKYHILVSRLEPSIAELVQDVLENKMTEYNELKKRIIAVQETKNVLEKQVVGARKPSEFLKHIKNLANNNPLFPKRFVRSVWVSKLDPYIQNGLLNDPNIPEANLAIIADIKYEEAQKQQQIEESQEKDCKCCKRKNQVALEINCVKLCEVLDNIELKTETSETRDTFTQTELL